MYTEASYHAMIRRGITIMIPSLLLSKSMRGSDPDAAVYYLARMLYAGEDVKFIAQTNHDTVHRRIWAMQTRWLWLWRSAAAAGGGARWNAGGTDYSVTGCHLYGMRAKEQCII